MFRHPATAFAWASVLACATFATCPHAATPNLARSAYTSSDIMVSGTEPIAAPTPSGTQPTSVIAPSVSSLDEGFDNITTLIGSGWFMQNNSAPLGTTNWFQGTSVSANGPFDAYDGAPNAYIGANFNNTTGGSGTISNWLLTPMLDFGANATLTFYTRKPVTPAGGTDYPDRLEVRLSTNGASTYIGSGGAAVGDFTTIALAVNADLVPGGYPYAWTQYTVSNLPHNGQGRIAFRYYVTSAGPTGSKSDYIGIDRVRYQTGAPEYQVGGTVSGLAGSGLVLRLNGSTNLPVSANGSFVFPTYITSGGSYAVTVGTQPSSPNQVCTVANGSGSVTATINDVQVSCTTNTYNVGGSITGLTGSGLTLKLNGTNDVVVSGSSFVFPNAVPDGTSYTATIAAQPGTPNQDCTLSNASGTVSGQDITSIEVHCTTRSYLVGGTVGGLTGSGLVVKLDNGDIVPVTGSSFVFPTPLLDGSSYAASVVSQPANPKQTCAFASATGAVAGADVTLALTCVTHRYTIGGDITGLDGQITLQLNGGNDLVATGNGPFTFPSIDDGTPWIVTVLAPPAGGSSTLCRLSGAAGTLAGASVDDVAVVCDYLFVDGFEQSP